MLRTLTILACGAGLLLLLAGHFAKAAFVAGSLRQGRVVSVDRAVSHGGFAHAKFRKEIRGMNDDELHDVIAESKKMMLHHRLEKFRRKKPSAGAKYEWQYKMALAKTFLKEKELAAMRQEEQDAPPAEPLSKDFPERPTLAEARKEEDLEMARSEWYDIGGWGSWPMGQKADRYPREIGFEKRYYKKMGKMYEPRDNSHIGGWSWDPSKSTRKTNLPPGWFSRPGGDFDRNVRWQAKFNKDSVDIRKARKKAEREGADAATSKAATETSTEALASEKAAAPSGGFFVGAAILGLAAARGRRFF